MVAVSRSVRWKLWRNRNNHKINIILIFKILEDSEVNEMDKIAKPEHSQIMTEQTKSRDKILPRPSGPKWLLLHNVLTAAWGAGWRAQEIIHTRREHKACVSRSFYLFSVVLWPTCKERARNTCITNSACIDEFLGVPARYSRVGHRLGVWRPHHGILLITFYGIFFCLLFHSLFFLYI